MAKLVLALFCALLVAIFAVQNAGTVVVGFLQWRFEISLALVILGSTVLGAVFVFLLGIVQQISRGRKIKEYRHRIQELEEELAARQEEELPLPVNGEGKDREEDPVLSTAEEEGRKSTPEGLDC